jgi:hypothetical protein
MFLIAPAPPQYPIVGSWISKHWAQKAELTFTFKKDGTFTSLLKSGPVTFTGEGAYTVGGNTVSMSVRKSLRKLKIKGAVHTSPGPAVATVLIIKWVNKDYFFGAEKMVAYVPANQKPVKVTSRPSVGSFTRIK